MKAMYAIILDGQKSIFTDLPVIQASSPKQAAEIYTGGKVKRVMGRFGSIVVESQSWPCKRYLYNKADPT